MNQEKIGDFIKKIRKQDGLTQEKFAQKYGVTYQAVSKWENGKNIPDITILKKMCDEYHMDLNHFLEGNENPVKKDKKKYFIIGSIVVIIGIFLLSFLFKKDGNDFQFKTLQTSCDNFNVYGSIAYNSNKTSIYISNITYCGEEDSNEYKQIECNLYESQNDIKTKISSYRYEEEEPISLDEFLKNVDFNIEHYSKTCTMYQDGALVLEIEATNINNETIFYKIPLKFDEDCDA